MFCGITMKNYVAENVSPKSLTTVKCGLKMFSHSSEAVIFMFLGVNTVNDQHEWNTAFILLTILFCSLYRALGTNFPLPAVIYTYLFLIFYRCNYFDGACQLFPTSSVESRGKIRHVLRWIAWSHRLRIGTPRRSGAHSETTALCYCYYLCRFLHGFLSSWLFYLPIFIIQINKCFY